MAGADYIKCEKCGARLVYEPDADPDIKVVCLKCYDKLAKKMRTSKKSRR